jgi:hypothetical protein
MAPPIDTTVDQKSVPQNNDQDPNVKLPQHVQDAARAAERFYEKPAKTPEEIAAETEAARVAAEAEATRKALEANSHLQRENQPPQNQEVSEESWQQRFLSMQGRWKSSQVQLGQLQEQLVQVGDELSRATELLSRAGVQQQAPHGGQSAPLGHGHGNLITEQDRETYGEDMIDLARRAALEAVSPELTALKAENADLKKNQISNAQKELRTQLARAVPNWKNIQADPRWAQFLRLPNIYTNEVRAKMLKAAWDAGDASRTIALFQDFEKEVKATGGQLPSGQQAQPTPAPREAALDLENLAAPGRARPASGDAHVPAEKPTYSRAQISQFYSDSRKGVYNGRQAEYDRIQNDLSAAQREGRIRG